MNVYMVADVRSAVRETEDARIGSTVRSLDVDDVPALAALYQRAYASEAPTLDQAVAEMRSAFEGKWGPLWIEASLAAWIDGEPVTVVQTVRRPSWTGVPECPWIIEVFTDPRRRQHGHARALLTTVCRVLDTAGEHQVGLTVDSDNVPAVRLYRSLGFAEVA